MKDVNKEVNKDINHEVDEEDVEFSYFATSSETICKENEDNDNMDNKRHHQIFVVAHLRLLFHPSKSSLIAAACW